MLSLLGLVATITLTILFYLWRGQALRNSRGEALAFACLYCLSLGLALRFGGRTYPGMYFPDSSLLNALLNSNFLFTGIGYLAVVTAWVAEVGRILLHSCHRSLDEALQVLKCFAVVLAVIIAVYGFVWAAAMQRLPG